MKTIAKIPAPSYSPTSVNGCSAGSSNNEVILSPVLALHQQMLPGEASVSSILTCYGSKDATDCSAYND